ncbi:beta-galactosidase [Roseobacter sp. HKCCD9010]|uniref:beta-galactosidase n=1 Tax=unclassified Roseobacter TaxID=196798 RepID=UPI001491DB4F|nr:beta-galactosidase [Rhodobacterales bacterium HKCCD4356]NNV10790.1 beta-galactosidase [Roseobacter sp. HKCCD7357]NNV14975.1 beta-galactosidase [Roseobacter sp. HKCCD8768]NNV24434.1 beta-galactosidase [Roseobacter sp. HKCCD8192]NNV28691.1 beta-galactosidase [Roseobacter sp. HKCCD9061]NNV32964.1 beta-galactosidase [Roseobacter sp. HKCCD9073]NNV37215.1 beta-galactosidase [Roseobacter sp. HKCCD9054]NNV41172.1 beta-galactosidase [Roseobacter sp. HKCCD6497]NNV45422.1 beta-galactosidase [Roseob
MKRTLGTCYYPEHWPEEIWAEDAARMADLGLTWVRIGEFAWSRLEPTPGELQFDWLDRAFEVLGQAGLRIVLGTPTATPPRWMLDRHPDMLAVDAEGRARGFGSRRHYCFSHEGYRAEAVRITTLLAERYGRHPALGAWQTDNEYGCHDTVISYSDAARHAFRDWLAQKYQSPEALNRAWGNVFWSMEYRDFDEIDLPNLTVTEPNPSHAMDFRRFSSDQVVRFNGAQVAAIRARSDAPISHNYMGRTTEFDHFATGDQMEIATWDSYPLGFLEDRLEDSAEHKRHYAHQGDPDFQAFHHDLYRSVGQGRWWIMEQQPGPVNWAPHNPAPLPGMVRFWTWEAFAHGAEAVCYFRWRQAPFAQEQMHAGLLRPDSAEAAGYAEAAAVAAELADAPEVETAQAPVALIFDYQAAWSWDVQPQGRGCDYFRLVFEIYRGLRKLGLSIDILPPETRDFEGYAMILAPGLEMPPDGLIAALRASEAQVLLGPRFGTKTQGFAILVPLPPAIPDLDIQVARVETLRPDMPVPVDGGGAITLWREDLLGGAEVLDRDANGRPVLVRSGAVHYLGGWPDPDYLARVLTRLAERADVPVLDLPQDIRLRQSGTTQYVFNHGHEPVTFGGEIIPQAGVLRR